MPDTELIQIISLALGIGLGSGFNIYATILVLGIAGATGSIVLPSELQILQNPLVIIVSGLMYGVEFFADKIPGFDSVWDGIHTFIRIPLGAILVSNVMADMGIVFEAIGFIAGGSLAGASHLTKAGTRAIINTSPEPVSNWSASIMEDVAVFSGLWMAINHPIIWISIALVIIILLIWILPKIWRGIKFVLKKIKNVFIKNKE